MTESYHGIISFLDNDLYKFTMQNVVLKHYRDTQVVYHFINRNTEFKLNEPAVDWLRKQIDAMAHVRPTEQDLDYMRSFPFFDDAYLDYLATYRYQPEKHVQLTFDNTTQQISLLISGLWLDTILYEVPLLSLTSEAYFKFVDRDWDYANQALRAYEKCRTLIQHGCKFSEFGSRRRRDFKTHDLIMQGICDAALACQRQPETCKGMFLGTSNLYFARKYNVPAMGSVAHEFIMGLSALVGVKEANKAALAVWQATYKGAMSIALTDTYTTEVFIRDFKYHVASSYAGVRHDSGDPLKYANRITQHYKALGIDPATKLILFSDGLHVQRAVDIQATCDALGIGASFGIGTHFTNDFCRTSSPSQVSKAMNIVIKMQYCNGKRVIKLSDDASKHSARRELVEKLQHELGIE